MRLRRIVDKSGVADPGSRPPSQLSHCRTCLRWAFRHRRGQSQESAMSIPPVSRSSDATTPEAALARLLGIMARLRDPVGGCPWDQVQDFSTIAPYTVEEAYEVADAIRRGPDFPALLDELGDLLFQVVYHAQMAKEAGHFDFAAIAEAISAKMLRRHPHVFGE